MLRYHVKCDSKPITISIGVEVRVPAKVVIKVSNPTKRNTVYMDRWQTVQKKGTFEVRLPQSCEKVLVEISCQNNSNDDNIRLLEIKKKKIKQYIPCLSGGYKIKSFVKFAQNFSENAGVLPAGTYWSDNKQFRIDYMPKITQDGKVLSTPARISNKNGRMEVSMSDFQRYTVPMRMAILLHEFAHFNMNDIQKDEIEADLNALKVYLGLGYPVIEAHKSFLRVFQNSPNKPNKERYDFIKTFIDKFDSIKYKICLP